MGANECLLCRYNLVEAELARIMGNTDEAQTSYDNALLLAHQNGFLHDEALAGTCNQNNFVVVSPS